MTKKQKRVVGSIGIAMMTVAAFQIAGAWGAYLVVGFAAYQVGLHD